MDSTFEVTQRLERLSIAPNEPALCIVNQPVVSSETSTQASALHQTQVQPTTAGITIHDSDNDVTMSDDLITATMRNLSIRSSPLQNRSALEAHGRGHAEWSRLCNQRQRHHGTVSIAMMNIRSRQRQASQALPRPRPRPRPSSREAREEAGSFFRHCAQMQRRRTGRAHHHHQRSRSPPVITTSEAVGLTREEHHRNLFRAQLRVRQQIRLVSAIAAGAGH